MYNININYIIIFLLIIIIVSHYITPNEKFVDTVSISVPNNNYITTYNNNVVEITSVDAANTWTDITSFTNFPDKDAQWIWYTDFKSNKNKEDYQFSFNFIYNQTMSKDPLQVYLFIIVDDSCVVFLNKAFISKCSKGWEKKQIPFSNILSISLVFGQNFFEFYLANNVGPSGFVCTVINPLNNKVIFNSNKSWTFVNYGIPFAFNNNYNLSLSFT